MIDPSPRWRHVATSVAGVVAALALSACGDDLESTTVDAPDAARDVARDASVTLGQTVFSGNCASCHGTDLDGTSTGPPLRHVVYEPGHHPDDSFRQAIAQGASAHHWQFGPMPPVEGLATEEVDAVIAYVRHRQETDGFIE